MKSYTARRPYRPRPNLEPLPDPVWKDGNLTLCLPMPPRSISPNASRGESTGSAIRKSKLIKAYRDMAKLMMCSALAMPEAGKAEFCAYSLRFLFRTNALRDDDNADGSVKAYRDGIAKALRMDDAKLRKVKISELATDAKCPRVEVTMWRVAPATKSAVELAGRIATRLFTNAFGGRGTRLEIKQGTDSENERSLGGWCYLAAVNQIADILANES